MHHAAVIPDHHVAHQPLVAVFKFLLRRVRNQFIDQRHRGAVFHADDGIQPHRVEIEKFAPVVRMHAHQRVHARRRQHLGAVLG